MTKPTRRVQTWSTQAETRKADSSLIHGPKRLDLHNGHGLSERGANLAARACGAVLQQQQQGGGEPLSAGDSWDIPPARPGWGHFVYCRKWWLPRDVGDLSVRWSSETAGEPCTSPVDKTCRLITCREQESISDYPRTQKP